MGVEITIRVIAESMADAARMTKKAAEQMDLSKFQASVYDQRYGIASYTITNLNARMPTGNTEDAVAEALEAVDLTAPEEDNSPELGGPRRRER